MTAAAAQRQHEELLRFRVEGNLDADEAMIFLHGWPDDSHIFDSQVQQFGNRYRCILLELPNYGGGKPSHPWGLSLDRLQLLIWNTIDHALEQAPAAVRENRPTLVGHDWGAFFAWRLLHSRPRFFKRAVCIDISPSRNTQLSAVLFSIAYQWTLIWLWVIGHIPFVGRLADLTCKAIARVFRSPTPAAKINASMNYLYVQVWLQLLTFGLLGKPLPSRFEPGTSIFYVFGGKKPFHFHSDRFLDKFQSGKWAEHRCRWKEIKGAGHWVHYGKTSNEFNDAFQEFIDDTQNL